MYLVVNLEMGIHITIEDWNKERCKMIWMLRDILREDQNCMKQNVGKRRVDKEYTKGEMVYLKLQSYRQSMVAI